jgi:hypothetical protein
MARADCKGLRFSQSLSRSLNIFPLLLVLLFDDRFIDVCWITFKRQAGTLESQGPGTAGRGQNKRRCRNKLSNRRNQGLSFSRRS